MDFDLIISFDTAHKNKTKQSFNTKLGEKKSELGAHLLLDVFNLSNLLLDFCEIFFTDLGYEIQSII